MIAILIVAVVYVFVVYPIVKILQGVQEDVRNGATDYPTKDFTVL